VAVTLELENLVVSGRIVYDEWQQLRGFCLENSFRKEGETSFLRLSLPFFLFEGSYGLKTLEAVVPCVASKREKGLPKAYEL
jgi:hypothetical protein